LNPTDLLLVDDSPPDIALALHVVQERRPQPTVIVAHRGADALDFVFATGKFASRDSTDRPRLILLDAVLPGISGLEVLQRLKGNPRSRAIPVVVLSNSRAKTDLDRFYAAGVNAYLYKDTDFDNFSRALHITLDYWLKYNLLPPPATA
jgi:two-component system response regulator